ncbi:MAG TPA: glutamate-1-semialdehyde 2,1-aminomutase [Promineifilum sp.]
MNIAKSVELFKAARQLLPGGVDSPARAFRAVGGQPIFISYGEGPYLIDVDGNRYIDYVLSFGPLLRGHAHPDVVRALTGTAALGTSFGAPSPLELDLARSIMSFMPSIEMIRLVNSGTEATMSALRLARAFTRRDKIIKFQGNYHGHADMLLVQAGSGVATLGLPDSPGVPAAASADTLVATYNDLDSVSRLFELFPNQIAAIIVEPVPGNMGVVPPRPGFLPGLQAIAAAGGAMLIFDEVMSGFRVHPGGAQALYAVRPDITTLGKIIGGGLPVGAYGGRREIMEMVAPSGPMYQAGTLSGNPLAMAAGIATLAVLNEPSTWPKLEEMTRVVAEGFQAGAAGAGLPVHVAHVGAMFTTFFSEEPVTDWSSAARSNTARFAKFHRAMLENGIYLPPSQFEACFLSLAHTPDIVEQTISAAEHAFLTLRRDR